MKGIDKSLANIRLKFERVNAENTRLEKLLNEKVTPDIDRDKIEAETLETAIFNIERLFRTHKEITAVQIIECIKTTKLYRPGDER